MNNIAPYQSPATTETFASFVDPSNWFGTDEMRVNSYTSNQQLFPSMVRTNNESLIITWTSYGQDSAATYGVFETVINEWGNNLSGNDILVNTYTSSDEVYPRISSFNTGNFVISWTWGPSADPGVKAQLLDGSGNKVGSETIVNQIGTGPQLLTNAAQLNNETIVITWQTATTAWDVKALFFDKNLNSLGNEFYINTYTTSDQSQADIIALSSGGFRVVWHSDGQDGSGFSIVMQEFDAQANRIQGEKLINTFTTGNQWYPSIFALNDDEHIVVWNSDAQDGSGLTAMMQAINAAGDKIGGEIQVNTYTSSDQFFCYSGVTVNPIHPGTVLSDGSFIVSWSSAGQDGSGYGVYAQRFDAQKNKLGPEFRVNDVTTYDQDTAVVAPLKNGKVAITWQSSQDEGGTANNIYIKIMGPLTFSLDRQTLVYERNTPLSFTNLFIDSPRRSVTLTLILENPLLGSLSATKIGPAIPTYNTATGIWQLSGNVDDINKVLTSLTFIPTKNRYDDLSLYAVLKDDKSNAITSKITLHGKRHFAGLITLGILSFCGLTGTAVAYKKREQLKDAWIKFFKKEPSLQPRTPKEIENTDVSHVVQVRGKRDISNLFAISPKNSAYDDRSLVTTNPFFQPK